MTAEILPYFLAWRMSTGRRSKLGEMFINVNEMVLKCVGFYFPERKRFFLLDGWDPEGGGARQGRSGEECGERGWGEVNSCLISMYRSGCPSPSWSFHLPHIPLYPSHATGNRPHQRDPDQIIKAAQTTLSKTWANIILSHSLNCLSAYSSGLPPFNRFSIRQRTKSAKF